MSSSGIEGYLRKYYDSDKNPTHLYELTEHLFKEEQYCSAYHFAGSLSAKTYENKILLLKAGYKSGQLSAEACRTLCRDLLSTNEGNEDDSTFLLNLQSEFIDSSTEYPTEMVQKIQSRRGPYQVTFKITFGKSLYLFKNTMNSFITCCEDITRIGRWLCVADSKHHVTVQQLYPFLEFVGENHEITTPYSLELDGNWYFFKNRQYVMPAIQLLAHDKSYDRVLFNKNSTDEGIKFEYNGHKFIEQASHNCPTLLRTKNNSHKAVSYDTVCSRELEFTSDDYTFYHLKDSVGHDCSFVGDLPIDKLKEICDANHEAVAFNTLGYIKNRICSPENMIKLPIQTGSGHGLYVKKDKPSNESQKISNVKMVIEREATTKIRAVDVDLYKYSLNGHWKNLELTDKDDADYTVVMGEDNKVEGTTIVINPSLVAEWTLEMNYIDLKVKDFSKRKENKVAINSGIELFSDIEADRYEKFPTDCHYVIVDNPKEFIDAIVTETLCFYCGHHKLSDEFEGAFITVPIDKASESVCKSIIVAAMNSNLYQSALPAIKQAKEKVLEENQCMPIINKMIITE